MQKNNVNNPSSAGLTFSVENSSTEDDLDIDLRLKNDFEFSLLDDLPDNLDVKSVNNVDPASYDNTQITKSLPLPVQELKPLSMQESNPENLNLQWNGRCQSSRPVFWDTGELVPYILRDSKPYIENLRGTPNKRWLREEDGKTGKIIERRIVTHRTYRLKQNKPETNEKKPNKNAIIPEPVLINKKISDSSILKTYSKSNFSDSSSYWVFKETGEEVPEGALYEEISKHKIFVNAQPVMSKKGYTLQQCRMDLSIPSKQKKMKSTHVYERNEEFSSEESDAYSVHSTNSDLSSYSETESVKFTNEETNTSSSETESSQSTDEKITASNSHFTLFGKRPSIFKEQVASQVIPCDTDANLPKLTTKRKREDE